MVGADSTDVSRLIAKPPTNRPSWPLFWLVVWIGTVAAGGVFGLFAGAILGLFVGPFFAGFVGVPVVITVAIVTWACWLSRFATLMAACAGAVTGFLSAAIFWSSLFDLTFVASVCLAGPIGGVGAGVCALAYRNKFANRPDIGPWRFSMRDLFIRMTVVAILVAGWTWATKSYLHASQQSRASLEQMELERQRLRSGKLD